MGDRKINGRTIPLFTEDFILNLMPTPRDVIRFKSYKTTRRGGYRCAFVFCTGDVEFSTGSIRIDDQIIPNCEMRSFLVAWERAVRDKKFIDDEFNIELRKKEFWFPEWWTNKLPLMLLSNEITQQNGQAKILFSSLRVFADYEPCKLSILVVGSSSPGLSGRSYPELAEVLTAIGFSGYMELWDVHQAPTDCKVGNFDMSWRCGQYHRGNFKNFDVVLDDAWTPGWDMSDPWKPTTQRLSVKSFDGDLQPYYGGSERRKTKNCPPLLEHYRICEGMDECFNCRLVARLGCSIACGRHLERIYASFVTLGVSPCTSYIGQKVMHHVGKIKATLAKGEIFDTSNPVEGGHKPMIKAAAIVSRDRIVDGTIITPMITQPVARSPVPSGFMRSQYKVSTTNLEKLRRFRRPNKDLTTYLQGRSFSSPGIEPFRLVGEYLNVTSIDRAEVAFITDLEQLNPYSPPEIISTLVPPKYRPIGEITLDNKETFTVWKLTPGFIFCRDDTHLGTAEIKTELTPIRLRSTKSPYDAAASVYSTDTARAIIARYHLDEGGTTFASKYVAVGEMNYTTAEWSELIRVCTEYVRSDGKVKMNLSNLSRSLDWEPEQMD